MSISSSSDTSIYFYWSLQSFLGLTVNWTGFGAVHTFRTRRGKRPSEKWCEVAIMDSWVVTSVWKQFGEKGWKCAKRQINPWRKRDTSLKSHLGRFGPSLSPSRGILELHEGTTTQKASETRVLTGKNWSEWVHSLWTLHVNFHRFAPIKQTTNNNLK